MGFSKELFPTNSQMAVKILEDSLKSERHKQILIQMYHVCEVFERLN